MRSRRQPSRHVFRYIRVEQIVQLLRDRSRSRRDLVAVDLSNADQIAVRRRNKNFVRRVKIFRASAPARSPATPASGAISKSIPRVTPSRHPEFKGGVKTLPFFTAKIFAAVHSATSPRSFSSTTSSNPSFCASATAQTFCSHEVVLTPASGEAACRPCSRKRQPHRLVILRQRRRVNNQIHFRMFFVALPKTNLVVHQINARRSLPSLDLRESLHADSMRTFAELYGIGRWIIAASFSSRRQCRS